VLAVLRRRMEKLAPPDRYDHDNFDIRTENEPNPADTNGYAHCSVQLPVTDGRLGDNQRVLFLELDKARSREVTVQIAVQVFGSRTARLHEAGPALGSRTSDAAARPAKLRRSAG
jgi:hypothetical protein